MINPLARVPVIIARAAHSVITEYRRLDQSPPEPGRQELSCTAASTETTWQPVSRAPASPRAFGFTRPPKDVR